MSDEEAKGVLRAEFIRLRAAGYPDLVRRLAGAVETTEVVGLSNTTLYVELQGFWDDDEHRALRVVASIDDGGARAFSRSRTPSQSAPMGGSRSTRLPDRSRRARLASSSRSGVRADGAACKLE